MLPFWVVPCQPGHCWGAMLARLSPPPLSPAAPHCLRAPSRGPRPSSSASATSHCARTQTPPHRTHPASSSSGQLGGPGCQPKHGTSYQAVSAQASYSVGHAVLGPVQQFRALDRPGSTAYLATSSCILVACNRM